LGDSAAWISLSSASDAPVAGGGGWLSSTVPRHRSLTVCGSRNLRLEIISYFTQ
jgi:hypothetical protein